MTPQCQEWIAFCAKHYPCKGDVLEVGSFDVNGNPRVHFADKRFTSYIGVDMREGPCVDRVMNTQKLEFSDDSFDVIVDAERIEHDNRFWLTVAELFRVCRPGGHIIITTRSWGGFPPHDYPSDYWRFMDNGLRDLLEYAGFECLATAYGERWEAGDKAVFAVGRKPLEASKSNPLSIVILSANPENLIPCVRSVLENEPGIPPHRIIVVDDGARAKAERELPYEITWVSGSKPFVFARNVNIGIAKANSDVILLNDDALLMTKHGFTEMSKRPGIVSAAIDGPVANRSQHLLGKGLRKESRMLCFIAVLIPKSAQETLGPLDERFIYYGYDDDDYSRRAIDAGIPLHIFDGCIVKHGTLKPTFRSKNDWRMLLDKNEQIFKEKYPSTDQKSLS